MPFNGTVLQVIPTLDTGGAERTTLEIGRAIVDAGGRSLVASAGGRREGELEAGGIGFIRLPVHSKNPWTIWRNAAHLANIVKAHDVDIIHVRSRAPAWSALWAARRTRTALVSTYHGAYKNASAAKRFYNSGVTRADLVIANSDFTALSIRAQYSFHGRRLVTIPRGADLTYFNPETITPDRIDRLCFGWALDEGAQETFRLLAPARLTPWKGQEDIIEALSILAGNSSSLSLSGKNGAGHARKYTVVFCGDQQGKTDFKSALQQKMNERGVRFDMKLVGHCADMPAAYAWCDAVLAPSRRPEAFGRVAVEAGAMEKPVIATGHGGALETIIDGVTGILVAQEDPEALAEAIQDVADLSVQARQNMGAAARQNIVENFSIEAMCKATLVAYDELLETRQKV